MCLFSPSQTYLQSAVCHAVRKTVKINVGEKVKDVLHGAQHCWSMWSLLFYFLLKLINFSVESSRPQEDDSEWNDLTKKLLLPTHLDFVWFATAFWIVWYETASRSETFCSLWKWVLQQRKLMSHPLSLSTTHTRAESIIRRAYTTQTSLLKA